MGTCYGGDAATGVDGSDSIKTQCMLAGECLTHCDDIDGGVVCEAQCQVDYGQQAETDWTNTADCVGSNCTSFCP
jgi:hypothetical protein